MSVLTTIEYPPCHKAKSAPQQWDAEFESVFRLRGTFSITTARGYFNACLMEERHEPEHDSTLQEYAFLKKQLCGLQRNVSARAISFISSEGFATKWLAASVKKRAKHALAGMAGACAISPNLNKARLSCSKELRVKYLSENGQAVLDLLNAIAPADLSEIPSEPQYIANDDWDKLHVAHQDTADEIEKLVLNSILVLRNKLITHTLDFIMDSFLGHELPVVPVYKTRHVQSDTPNQMTELTKAAMVAKYGKEEYDRVMAENEAAFRERKANKVNACEGCGREGGKRETFKRCAACWKISRQVLYCSKECQVKDWKAGHKLMCGKALDFDTAAMLSTLVPKASNPSGFPPPAPGFKRSLELLSQMDWLMNYPDYDYAVKRSVYERNEHTGLMTYNDPKAKARFRKHREKAMTTGNPMSVALMLEYILWDFEVRKSQDFRRDMVVDQLSREYNIPIKDLEELLEYLGGLRAECGLPALAYSDGDLEDKEEI
ncbi:hypothetical protein CVT26_005508 [Gymnopilus dilepis]|uniref:MYND-type domain-containing protein n=1 Tax=Gymnopilus dilepis TaxID=231916 RepID=A0A409XZI5_9AGAR|nr:hypothetical protein CVT26_005508 [Gymnopilus dilepis]